MLKPFSNEGLLLLIITLYTLLLYTVSPSYDRYKMQGNQ